MTKVAESHTDAVKFVANVKATTAKGKVPEAMNQLDNDCGIYAMYVGLNFESQSTSGKQFAMPPRARRDPKDKSTPKAPNSSIRQVAKQSGYSKIGELFDASQVADLARKIGGKADLVKLSKENDMFDQIKKAVDGGRTVMVPYCNNKGEPKFDGTCAHWALAFGYYEESATKYVLATHWGKYWSWKADDLAKSNFAIADWVQADYEKTGAHDWNPAKPSTSGGTATIAKPKLVIPAVCLSSTLAKMIVLLG